MFKKIISYLFGDEIKPAPEVKPVPDQVVDALRQRDDSLERLRLLIDYKQQQPHNEYTQDWKRFRRDPDITRESLLSDRDQSVKDLYKKESSAPIQCEFPFPMPVTMVDVVADDGKEGYFTLTIPYYHSRHRTFGSSSYSASSSINRSATIAAAASVTIF